MMRFTFQNTAYSMNRVVIGVISILILSSCASDEPNELRYDKLNSPHFITESIDLEEGKDFIVEAGAHLIISDGVEINLRGRVIMEGTQLDSIIIDPVTPGVGWQRISLKGEASILSMSHVRLTDGIITSYSTDNDIHDCVFFNRQDLDWESAMLRFWFGKLDVSQCKFYGINKAEGILVHDTDNVQISNNQFDKVPDAIELIGSEGSLIYGNEINLPGDDGIDLNGCLDVTIDGNIIINAGDAGMEIGSENFGRTINAQLQNNVLDGCKKGIWLKESSTAHSFLDHFASNEIGIDIITPNDSTFVSRIVLEQATFDTNGEDIRSDMRSEVEIIN